ncbi:helix-turn-helix domain-containing protein [Spirosoma foliorum]|uniref:AraC family transcriptional regulator n=1 Tax=Spirosoma foliorum TaxID=2710596 RepID=A0A7G5H1J2_9BACT|nr:helix-turn-helix domain-containing protein [Spirosoma foliorum]QMW04984.1 AraC family transcriptional regulator [Spirosoma foliorum]
MNEHTQTIAQTFAAPEGLTEVFRHIYYMKHPREATCQSLQLFPHYEMMLVFNFGPPISVSVADHTSLVERVAILGPLDRVLTYELLPESEVMVIVFTLNGFYRLLGKPIHPLRTETENQVAVPVTYLTYLDLWENLVQLPSIADRAELLMTYIQLHVAPEDTAWLLDEASLFSNLAIDPIKIIAQNRRLSARSVQLRLRNMVGFSAKEIARFIRFKNVIAHLVKEHPRLPDWADLVVQHGYHDQPHLIRDFQRYLGLSPTDFVNQLAEQPICITQPGKHY